MNSPEQHRRQRILIADDSEMNRSILADMLGEEYDILEAEDGVKAVAALQKYRTAIDLVLLDIVMPEMDGFEVLTLMNQQGWIEDIPVIMISAETAPAHVERAYNLGPPISSTAPSTAWWSTAGWSTPPCSTPNRRSWWPWLPIRSMRRSASPAS